MLVGKQATVSPCAFVLAIASPSDAAAIYFERRSYSWETPRFHCLWIYWEHDISCSKIYAILRKARKVQHFGVATKFELSANGGGAVCSVAVGRRLVNRKRYLSKWNRKLLSL